MSENWAITIGINEYSFMRPLKYAMKDADAMRQLFLSDQLNFRQVCHFTDQSEPIPQTYGPDLNSKPTRANLRRFLRTRFDRPFLNEGDNLWFFFAGHGVRYQDRDYLMPADGDRSDITDSAIPLNYISERLRRSGADNVILLIDACRDNEGRRSGIGIGQEKQQGVVTLFSCSPEESSHELSELQQGAFTHVLLESLQIQGEGNCATVERLYQRLRHRVPELIRQYKRDPQTPYGIIEPLTKNHLILLPRQASLADVLPLKNDALFAEVKRNFKTAKQLWIRVLAVSPSDPDAIDAIERLALQNTTPQAANPSSQISEPATSTRTPSEQTPEPAPPIKASVSPLSTVADSPPYQTPDSFSDYQKIRLVLIKDLERLRDFSKKLDLTSSVSHLENMIQKMHDDKFSVAVIGEFNRGRSTFINALLGQEILPADILPCTAALTRVTYGIKPKAKILFRDGRENEVDIDVLDRYVTKLTPEAQDKAANIREAVVYYPTQYCQNGVDIIDTPGINDEATMDELTLSVLPKVDAVILVVLATAPFTETERGFLEEKLLTGDIGRVIFVMTGIDRCKNPEDIDRHLAYFKDRLVKMIFGSVQERYGKDSPEYESVRAKVGYCRVYGLSSYEALEAKMAGNQSLLAKSHFPEFEAAFEKFLTEERAATFLQIPLNRMIASASEIIKFVNLRKEAQQITERERQELETISSEASRILRNAYRLSTQLIQEVAL